VTTAFSLSFIQAPKKYFETGHDSSLPHISQFMFHNITEQADTAIRLQTRVQDLTLSFAFMPSMCNVCAVQQDAAI
jgi:hypothetical protein